MNPQSVELSPLSPLHQPTPVLRRDLLFRPQTFGNQHCYVVEDPVRARYFRVGRAEQAILSRLDGRRTIGEALRDALAADPQCSFTPSDVLAICQWALQSGLARDPSAACASSTSSRENSSTAPSRRGRISPLSMQVPLCHPDRFFTRLTPFVSWCFTSYFLVCWLLLIAWATHDLMLHPQRLWTASSGVLAPNNWLWLAIVWLLLKVVHECGHAVACKRYGGEVREAGVIFILLAPLAYVDVTSSWRFSSKWPRIAVAAAGMYVELFLAAIAALIWVRLEPSTWSQLCMNVMLASSVMTVVFNANPLMRFDGYYMLSDFLELPNLSQAGQAYVRYVVRRYLLGMRGGCPVGPGPRGHFLRLYGVTSWIWRNIVFFGLVLTAATLLEGAGIVLSLAALVMWLTALGRRAYALLHLETDEKPRWLRCVLISGAMAGAATLLLIYVPWPGSVTAPAIIRYAPETIVRADSAGFVREVRVQSGQRVAMGQVLVVLQNEPLQMKMAQLELEVRQSTLQHRVLLRQNELAKAQAESERLANLNRQCDEKRQQLEQLIVRAPRAGNVVGRNLDAWQGRYLAQGSPIVAIGDEAAKEVRVSIAQEDILNFRSHLGADVSVYFPDSHALVAPLSRIEPGASTTPLHLSLCASHGGDLAIRNAIADTPQGSEPACELLSPRFTGVVALSAEQSQGVRAGQRANVSLAARDSIGRHLFKLVTNWVDSKLHRRSKSEG